MNTPRWLERLGTSLMIGGQAISAIAQGRIGVQDLLQELFEAGPASLLIIMITGLAAGTVFNIQVAAELSSRGASMAVGGLLALGLAREIAPLLTATLLTGKVATAYAAQLGTMKVTEQIDAITMLRTDPVQYLVVPRLLAMVVMAPVQCLLFFWMAIWSGRSRASSGSRAAMLQDRFIRSLSPLTEFLARRPPAWKIRILVPFPMPPEAACPCNIPA
jgi:phospholipid/cholesterol/gamma-HCH transport system permease protein